VFFKKGSNMKNTILAGVIGVFTAGTAAAQNFGGEVGVEFSENAAGNYVAETSLGFNGDVELGFGTAFAGATILSTDGDALELDEWQLGVTVGAVTGSIGEQGDVFVGGAFEVVGEDTLALPSDDFESVIVSHDMGLSAMVGFEDLSTDAGEINNYQLAYSTNIGQFDVTGAVDYNENTEVMTYGAAADYGFVNGISVGGVATFNDGTDMFAYEANAGYNDYAVFINGDEDDMTQNIGGGYNADYSQLNVYAEVSYDLDEKDETFGLGAVLNF